MVIDYYKRFHYNNQLKLLCIPFISDTLTSKLYHSLKDLHINAQVVAIPPTNHQEFMILNVIVITVASVLIKMDYIKLKVVYTELTVMNVMVFT